MANTEMAENKRTNKDKLRNLRLSLRYRPKIMQLILNLRQGIRRRNAEIKSLKHRLEQEEKRKLLAEENSNVNPSVKSKSFQNLSTQTSETSDLKTEKSSKNLKDSKQKDTNKETIETEQPKATGWNDDNEKSIADQVKEAALNALNEFESKAGWNIDNNSGEKEKSIAEQVKEVAQNALQQRGMVFVESAGMYYDYKTGYYYNSELGLYYHTDTNCYYYFSDEKQQFVFHSYPDTSAVNANLIAHQKKKARKQLKRERKPEDDVDKLTKTLSKDNEDKKPKRKKILLTDRKKIELTDEGSKAQNGKEVVKVSEENPVESDIFENSEEKVEKVEKGVIEGKKENNDEQSEEKMVVSAELEDGECSDSSDDCSSNASTATKSDEDAIAKHHAPCMRVIVRETDLPKLKVGTLFLITKDGGTVGREGEQHTVLIRDTNVSRNHLDVRYDMERQTYVATDLGSKNGTILNGNRMSESSEISSPMDILHGSTIQLGETKLLCHIHPGNDTCGHCEPGLIMESEDKEKKAAYTRTCSVKKQHELELARLKNIYAPQLLQIEEKPYNDRAQARRDTVGSTHHSVKTETSDLDTSISTENKGFKLLQKMGWSEGEGLGKESQGNIEPVPLISNDGKAGLGTTGAVAAPSMMPKPRPKNTIASSTMRLAARTKMLQPPAKAFQGDGDEDFE